MSQSKHLTILQMNDSHAYLDLHWEMFIENGEERYQKAGGYGRIATVFKQIREENPNGVLTLDNGDTFHGTYPAVSTKGEALVPILNALEFDGMTAHWEFAYGPQQFRKLVSMLNYPMLATNIYQKHSDEPLFPSHTIVERSGLHIGVIGIAEHIVDKTMPPHFSEGIYFTLGNQELPGVIQKLREQDKVDLIVVLSHFGLPQDVKLANEVDGIDIILSGHTHNRMTKPVTINDTIIIQSGCHGSLIGKLDVEVANGTIQNFKHELIKVSQDIDPDPLIQKLVESVLEPHQEVLTNVVGHTTIDLNRYSQLETTMDNFLLEALLDVSGAEIAFSNGWRYGAPVPSGEITMNDLWNIIPTNPPVSVIDITGAEIIAMLEENIESTFASDPYEQMGGYLKRCLGMNMYVKLENPKGMRVQDLFINNELMDEEKTYHACFVTVQGVPKKYGRNRRNLDISAIDALKQYLSKNKSVSPVLRNTVQLI